MGAQLIFDQFKKIGLEMHIWRGGKLSKTECVFFPTPRFFKKKHIFPASEKDRMGELIESPKIVCTKEEEKGGQTETVYNRLAETRFIIVSDGFISFCAHFKYLGSWLSFSLRDYYDVSTNGHGQHVDGCPRSFLGRSPGRYVFKIHNIPLDSVQPSILGV